MLTKQQFIAWLTSRGFTQVSNAPEVTYEKGDVRYIVRQDSLGKRIRYSAKRIRYSANRWSGMETWRYSKRFINRQGKLDWV